MPLDTGHSEVPNKNLLQPFHFISEQFLKIKPHPTFFHPKSSKQYASVPVPLAHQSSEERSNKRPDHPMAQWRFTTQVLLAQHTPPTGKKEYI